MFPPYLTGAFTEVTEKYNKIINFWRQKAAKK